MTRITSSHPNSLSTRRRHGGRAGSARARGARVIGCALIVGAWLGGAAPAGAAPPALEVWGGLADGSSEWGVLGGTPGMNLGILALRITRPLGSSPERTSLPAWEWTIDVIPVALMSPPLVSLGGAGDVECPEDEICVEPADPGAADRLFPPGTAFGVGFAPLGVTRRLRRSSSMSPFAGITGGILFFDRRVPTTRSSEFNFTASLEVGVRFGRPDHTGATLSYRFHHLSNAGFASENPGLASHLVSVGIHRPQPRPAAQGAVAR